MTDSTPSAKTKLPRWAWAVLFVVAVALPLGLHWRRGAGPDAAAVAEMVALGAEPIQRPLSDDELDQPIQTHDGKTTTLRALQTSGDTLILHFWASWCGPCMQELPEIVRLAETLQGRRVQVVSVSHDDAWEDADGALQKAAGKARPAVGVWLRELEGQSGEENKMLRVRLGTLKLPETYIIQDGQIVLRLIASQPWSNPRLLRALQAFAPLRS